MVLSCLSKKATDLWIAAQLNRLAVDNLLYAAGKRALDIGIFYAIHTYGRRLNWHPHLYVSVTCGGIDEHGKWKKISFRKDAMRPRWMWYIRQLLLSVWSDGITLPASLSHITTEAQWRSMILTAGSDCWLEYMSKDSRWQKHHEIPGGVT